MTATAPTVGHEAVHGALERLPPALLQLAEGAQQLRRADAGAPGDLLGGIGRGRFTEDDFARVMDRLAELFESARDLDGTARASFLDEACAGDRGLRRELEQMLDASKDDRALEIEAELLRDDTAALPEVSEMQAVRHYTRLSQKNFSIDTQFYPLGSCTMKYNPRACNSLAMLPGFLARHPLAPASEGQGFLACMYELQSMLCEAMGMAAFSLAPMAGAQGEFAGIKMIRAYHQARGDSARNEILVPDAAHGTNPATATMCAATSGPAPGWSVPERCWTRPACSGSNRPSIAISSQGYGCRRSARCVTHAWSRHWWRMLLSEVLKFLPTTKSRPSMDRVAG